MLRLLHLYLRLRLVRPSLLHLYLCLQLDRLLPSVWCQSQQLESSAVVLRLLLWR